MRVAIAGGGIGGLAAALALAKSDTPCLVLEQATQFGEIGAGIQLGPNAFHCFDQLGIGDLARAGAVYIDYLRMMDSVTGDEVCHLSLGDEFRQRFGNPYAVAHRADLHNALLDACEAHPLITLQTRSAVSGYENFDDHVVIKLADAESIEALALIGADGLHSSVRRKMLNDGEPRVSGHATYRSVIPANTIPDRLRWNSATLWAGPKCHIVHYPLKGGELFNVVVTYHNDVAHAVSGQEVGHDEVVQGFAHLHPHARRIVDHGRDWRLWVLCDREPVDSWVDGRVALLGDAAHPMMQYMAQGACMALEDAVSLGQCVASESDMGAALERYCERRAVRTARVVLGSRLMGDQVYHSSGMEAKVRNAVMSSRTQAQWLDRVQWLYDVDESVRPL